MQCVALAAAAQPPLTGQYKAWISDPQSSPATTFSHSAAPYVRVDGVRIADNWQALLTGSLQNPLNLDESGRPINTSVTQTTWTAVVPNGTFYTGGNCNDWQDFKVFGAEGIIGATDGTWSLNVGVLSPCTKRDPLYCVEQ
jgi:hypothetical protein